MMNKKRWLLASAVVLVFFIVFEYICHGILMANLYRATASLWRPTAQMQQMLPLGWLATLIFSLIMVYIYHRGYEGTGTRIGEGLRFGFLIGLFTTVPMIAWSYVSQPIPPAIIGWWALIGMVEMIVAGGIIGLIYRRAERR
jgi:hypothetical protein